MRFLIKLETTVHRNRHSFKYYQAVKYNNRVKNIQQKVELKTAFHDSNLYYLTSKPWNCRFSMLLSAHFESKKRIIFNCPKFLQAKEVNELTKMQFNLSQLLRPMNQKTSIWGNVLFRPETVAKHQLWNNRIYSKLSWLCVKRRNNKAVIHQCHHQPVYQLKKFVMQHGRITLKKVFRKIAITSSNIYLKKNRFIFF